MEDRKAFVPSGLFNIFWDSLSGVKSTKKQILTLIAALFSTGLLASSLGAVSIYGGKTYEKI